ncbi:MAG: competence/damage-inducible protein A [Candidatus Eremiobacteraeota bacterium]|nr:competence/damage-inducible protein A [Candidatus Eremiobacteraeota bacterium]
MTKPPSAALLVIGNEILSGKVHDVNTHFLARELFELGWELKEVAVVGDVQPHIVETLKRLHSHYDHIFTSGGVGPTHDDITLESIGLALDRRIVVSPMLEKILKVYYKTDLLTPAQQRLAWICEGSTLHYGPDSLYPQVVVDRVYPLPGIPELFRKKFQELKTLWPAVSRPGRRCFQFIAVETDMAAALSAVAEEHPAVTLGSYPREEDGVWHLELVLESRDSEALDAASHVLRQVLQGREMSWKEEFVPPQSAE